MRADIVTARAAVAHAAWHERSTVTRADIRAAARLALPHRRRRNPFDAPGLDEDLLDRILGDDDLTPPDPPDSPDPAESALKDGESALRDAESALENPADTTSSADSGPNNAESALENVKALP